MGTRKEYGIAFVIILITGLAFVALSGSVFSGYHFMDCSLHIVYKRDLSEMSFWKCLIEHITVESGSRFRPAWHLYTVFKTRLLGDNMLWQGFWQIFQNIIAAFLTYLLGRKIKYTHGESLLFAGISFTGTQSAIFYQTLSIETPALIVLLLSWFFILEYFKSSKAAWKTASYAGFILFSLLAALMKENFILALPASYLFYCMLYDEKHQAGFIKTFVRTWKTGVLLAFATITCLWAVLRFAGNDFGYAGIDRSIGFFAYIKTAVYLFGISGSVLALIGLLYLYANKKLTRKESLFPVLLFLAITIPQIAIYGKSNITDRYLIPAIVGCAYLLIYVFREIKKFDKPIDELFWRRIGLVFGIVTTVFCCLTVFSMPFQQGIVGFAVRLQGQVTQTMTSVSSMQYLASSLTTIGACGILIGCTLIIYGFVKNIPPIQKFSHLYAICLLLMLVMNAGLAFASCRRYAMRGFATENFLNTIINHSHENDLILIAGNPWVDMEGVSIGICVYLQKYDRKNLYICPVINNQQEEEWIPRIKDFYNNKDIYAIENKEMIQIIAIFPGSETEFERRNAWFRTEAFHKYEFSGNYVVYARK